MDKIKRVKVEGGLSIRKLTISSKSALGEHDGLFLIELPSSQDVPRINRAIRRETKEKQNHSFTTICDMHAELFDQLEIYLTCQHGPFSFSFFF